MNASLNLRRRGAVAAVAAVGLALGLAGCAENTTLAAHVPAGPPVCTALDGQAPATPVLGCFNKANLAAMVADPADLTRGRPETPAVGARDAAVIEQYKKGPEKKTGPLAPATTLVTTSTSGAQ